MLVSFLFINCKNEKIKSAKNEQPISKSDDFNTFIRKFKVLKLPLVMKPMEMQNVENLSPLTKVDLRFISLHNINFELDKVYPYGLLPDTLESYKVICLFPSEIYIPIMVTYSKSGKKISEETLSVGYCGSDCGFTCMETIKIYSDQKIYSVDSIESHECDSLGQILNTKKKYTHFINGVISKKGKIILSQIVKKKE